MALTSFVFIKLYEFMKTNFSRGLGGVNMKKSTTLSFMDRHKQSLIKGLYGISILIMFLGLYFSFFSVINQITIKVINTSVHGVIFGLLVFYLGLKYYFAMNKLKVELSADTTKFSWQNFKNRKQKKA